MLAAASAGLACWHLAAVTGLERSAFVGVMRGYANPPFFVSGMGTHEAPWTLRTLTVKPWIDSRQAPVVVSIGDDPGGVFQSSPPSPVDLAVVLRNLQRLGAKQAAIAAVLAWENPDPVALKGLDIVLNDFQMVIHAVPLARGTVRQALPPALRRASLPSGAIHGELAALPIVNRVAVPDVIFGTGEGALAGFTALDDTADGEGSLALLARWEEEDRVVLAFPLLAVLARYDLPVGGVQVQLGEFLQLGPSGPVVPIDEDGRLALPPKPVSARADVSAEALIDGEPDIFPASPGLLVLRDDQSTASHATRRFSATLASAIASIGSDAGLGPASTYRRLSAAWEVALLLSTVVVLTLVSGRARFRQWLGSGILAALWVASQWLALGMAQVWLPGLPLLVAILAGTLVAHMLGEAPPATRPPAEILVSGPPQAQARQSVPAIGRTFRSVMIWKEPARGLRVAETAPAVLETAPVVPTLAPVMEELAATVASPAKTPRKTAARKTAAKKTAARKTAARKTVARKRVARTAASPESTPPPAPDLPPV